MYVETYIYYTYTCMHTMCMFIHTYICVCLCMRFCILLIVIALNTRVIISKRVSGTRGKQLLTMGWSMLFLNKRRMGEAMAGESAVEDAALMIGVQGSCRQAITMETQLPQAQPITCRGLVSTNQLGPEVTSLQSITSVPVWSQPDLI